MLKAVPYARANPLKKWRVGPLALVVVLLFCVWDGPISLRRAAVVGAGFLVGECALRVVYTGPI